MSLKLDNLIRLFDFLSPHRWRTAEEIAKELEVDRRTVFRYMNEVELAFSPVPIVESSREGYRLCRNDFLDIMQSRDDYAGLAAVMSTPLGSLVRPERPLPERFATAIRDISNCGPWIKGGFRSGAVDRFTKFDASMKKGTSFS